MHLPGFAASALSGLVAAAGWLAHKMRSLSVAPTAWNCLACGVPNELDRDACWNCGEGYGQDPLEPSHVPMDRRWLCASCAVWNGIARETCWRCGDLRADPTALWATSPGRERPPGSRVPGALRSRDPRRTGAEGAWRRRNS